MTTRSGSLLSKLLARAASLRFDVLILILSAVFVASDALADTAASSHGYADAVIFPA